MSSLASSLPSLGSNSAAGNFFGGMSTYSSSLNNEISREVQIASLPIQILENDGITLSNQQSELQTLNSDLAGVQAAVAGIASAAGNMLTASVSNPNIGAATVASGATAGSYTLEVTNQGSYSDALSMAPASGNQLATVTNPSSQNIAPGNSFTLSVNGQTIQPPIVPAGGDLNSLAAAITAADAGVQATVVNVGPSGSPDYRLSLQSDTYGSVTMQLTDSNGDTLLQASGPTGQPVSYNIDGQAVTSGSRTVTLAPGVTVDLTGTTNTGSPATISVAPSTSGISGALQTFVSAYNNAITELNKNVGQGGGALAGQSIVYGLLTSLQGLANYAGGSGAITSMAALGLTFNDTSGQLSFNATTFDAATNGQSAAVSSFLGSATGGGFLLTATNALNSIEDPTTGILTQDLSSVQTSITNTNQQISDQQSQVSQLAQNLTQQMAAADSMIYSLQQQASYLQQMFQAENANNMAGLA